MNPIKLDGFILNQESEEVESSCKGCFFVSTDNKHINILNICGASIYIKEKCSSARCIYKLSQEGKDEIEIDRENVLGSIETINQTSYLVSEEVNETHCMGCAFNDQKTKALRTINTAAGVKNIYENSCALVKTNMDL